MPFAIHEPPESVKNVTLQFALLLRDGFADSDELLGVVTVTGGNITGQRKNSTGTFLFYGLKPGAQHLAVSSDAETPYYLSAKVGIQIPVPDPPPPVPFFVPPPETRLAVATSSQPSSPSLSSSASSDPPKTILYSHFSAVAAEALPVGATLSCAGAWAFSPRPASRPTVTSPAAKTRFILLFIADLPTAIPPCGRAL